MTFHPKYGICYFLEIWKSTWRAISPRIACISENLSCPKGPYGPWDDFRFLVKNWLWHGNYQSNLTCLEKPEFSKSLVNDLFLMYFSVDQLGAWCRSSPGGGTHFQNPNFEISSILALLACLRRFGTLKKNVIPDFTSILALLACLRRFGTLKKRPSPGNLACIQIFWACILHFWGMYRIFFGTRYLVPGISLNYCPTSQVEK